MKEKAILAGHVGEFGWECLRIAPHILWKKRVQYENKINLVLYTREDRLDLYGNDVNILVPMTETGSADCFKLNGLSDEKYLETIEKLKIEISEIYDVVETVFPAIENRRYTEKEQYPETEKVYDFQQRASNTKLFNSFVPSHKPLIVIAPRFREGFPRNYPHWIDFYDYLYSDHYLQKFTFVFCGKEGEYIKDDITSFYDINVIPQKSDTSLVGLAMAAIKRAVLTVGSQSGIPNLSNLMGTPTLQWGNEKVRHMKTYNVKNTKTIFIDDPEFNVKPKIIIQEMKNYLQEEQQNGRIQCR